MTAYIVVLKYYTYAIMYYPLLTTRVQDRFMYYDTKTIGCVTRPHWIRNQVARSLCESRINSPCMNPAFLSR